MELGKILHHRKWELIRLKWKMKEGLKETVRAIVITKYKQSRFNNKKTRF
jgi:hypothetical protein